MKKGIHPDHLFACVCFFQELLFFHIDQKKKKKLSLFSKRKKMWIGNHVSKPREKGKVGGRRKRGFRR